MTSRSTLRFLPGKRAGLIAPAGAVKEEDIAAGLACLSQCGFEYVFGRYSLENHGIVSAPALSRIEDIEGFLKDPQIDLLWALRGGYGTSQLFSQLNFDLFLQYPKPLIGFSDLTALQWALYQQTGLTSISGLTITSQMSGENPYLPFALDLLNGQQTRIDRDIPGFEAISIVRQGQCEGTLIGGTLSMICTLLGTPFWPDDDDLILFLEDINEPLYRIDRMLQQLALNGFWKRIRGLILGQFLNHEAELDITENILMLLPKGIPLIVNFPYGHIQASIPMPVGISAYLETDPFRLEWAPFVGAIA